MPGKKRFRSSLFGFRKKDVNEYIERMIVDFNNKLKEKDEEAALLKNQLQSIDATYKELACKAEQISEDRVKIADVLVEAKEKADLMIEEARKEALDEKKNLEKTIEEEKERLVDIKHDLKLLKEEAVNALKKYEEQLSGIIDNDSSFI
jgi:DNA repair exonuclease SbcCD ATPase subunit